MGSLNGFVEREPWVSPGAYRIYSRWVQAGDKSSRAVYGAVKDAWAVGAHEEAVARAEGRAPAARRVMELVDGFGQWADLREEDEAHFAGLAAEAFFRGAPLRRRLRLVWRLFEPRWLERRRRRIVWN